MILFEEKMLDANKIFSPKLLTISIQKKSIIILF